METRAIERRASGLYQAAGIDPATPRPVLLAASLGLRVALVDRLGRLGDLVGEEIRILGRANDRQRLYVVTHETSHRVLGHTHDDGPREAEATALGCALLAPMEAMYRMRLACGFRLRVIAQGLTTTETIVARRFVTLFPDEPFALVTPERVYATRMWPRPDLLRGIAEAGTRPEVKVVRLTDRAGCWLLVGRW